jgi:hypothetical protein
LTFAEVVGIDGEYGRPSLLEIPQEQFRELDLSAPFSLDRTFDLAISLDVAEHFPPEATDGFVESIARPVVLFSAAIPFSDWQSAFERTVTGLLGEFILPSQLPTH